MNSLELHFQEVATGGFYKKAILKSFTILTGKHLCRSYKVAGLKTFSFIKKRRQFRCFPVSITKCLRTLILKNICEQLLLTFFFVLKLG